MTVALKAYIKSELHPINHHQVRREIEIHSSLIHDNIIEFYGWFEDNCHYYIVQEFASGVSCTAVCSGQPLLRNFGCCAYR